MIPIVPTPADTDAANAAAAAAAAKNDPYKLPKINYFDPNVILNIINNYQDNYMDPWMNTMKSNTAFMTDVANLLKSVSDATTGGSDSSHVNFNKDLVNGKIQELINKYISTPLITTGAGEAGKQDAIKWANELGLDPDKCVITTGRDDDGNLTYAVVMDTTPLEKMRTALKDGNLDTAQYQAMQAALDAQKTVLQNCAQVLAEKFGRANSTLNSMMSMLSALQTEIMQRMLDFARIN